jgi:hypothetical protein
MRCFAQHDPEATGGLFRFSNASRPASKTQGGRGIRTRIAAVIATAAVALSPALLAAETPVPAIVRTRPQPESTRRMVERLAAIRANLNPFEHPFSNVQLTEVMRTQLAEARELADFNRLAPKYALQLLLSGKSEAAARQFEDYEALIRDEHLSIPAPTLDLVRLLHGVSFLRIGEQENCLAHHNPDSCLFPIRGGGIHLLPRGSEGAIRILNAFLADRPDDLRARWLLNIAHMTLGRYPDGVPERWRIPPSVFTRGVDFPRFPDIAGNLGLDIQGLAGGVITEDFDGDGFLDIMVSDWSLSGQLRLFHNNGDGTFSDRTDAAGLTGLVSGLNIQQTDYNNDGRPDVFVLRGAWLGKAGHYPRSLLRNNGDGTFTDVTEEAGLLTQHPTQTAAWFDYDGDGWLDVFIGNESSSDTEVNLCQLYHNNRDGTFTECAAASGVAIGGYVKGVATADFNHTGRPGLYISRRSEPNILLRNDGPQGTPANPLAWKFTDITATAGVAQQAHSFPTWFFDYDNDGWEDIMVFGYNIADVGDVCADYLGLSHTAERARLYHNNHDGTFKDVTREAGLYKVIHAMGCNFGDLDNDGWLDFYAGTGDPNLMTLIPNRMFRNTGGQAFEEVTTEGGFGNLQKGHGVAFADLDNDGDQDIFSLVGGAYSGDLGYSQLFLNPGNTNHWITLKVEGKRSNRIALGARIAVHVDTPRGSRTIYKTVGTGGSFGSSPLRQEIGLGQALRITGIDITWPTTGAVQHLAGPAMDAFYQVTEGGSAVVPWPLKPVTFPRRAGAHGHSGP